VNGVSVAETVSAVGRSTLPVNIFKGGNLQTTWFQHDKVPDWIYTTSENDWTANRIALAWLTDIFLPETQPPGDETRLLLFDGHDSHITVEFLWICKQNNVYIVFQRIFTSRFLISPYKPTSFRWGAQALTMQS
jgi:hypothetical protein